MLGDAGSDYMCMQGRSAAVCAVIALVLASASVGHTGVAECSYTCVLLMMWLWEGVRRSESVTTLVQVLPLHPYPLSRASQPPLRSHRQS